MNVANTTAPAHASALKDTKETLTVHKDAAENVNRMTTALQTFHVSDLNVSTLAQEHVVRWHNVLWKTMFLSVHAQEDILEIHSSNANKLFYPVSNILKCCITICNTLLVF